jgi:hypothetical protein
VPRKELLVALLPKTEALDRLKTEGWYHIPVETARKRWPPEVMAFYQGKVFGIEEGYKIRYFGNVESIDVVQRKVLFPDDEENKDKEEKPYYRVQLKALQERETPISRADKSKNRTTWRIGKSRKFREENWRRTGAIYPRWRRSILIKANSCLAITPHLSIICTRALCDGRPRRN